MAAVGIPASSLEAACHGILLPPLPNQCARLPQPQAGDAPLLFRTQMGSPPGRLPATASRGGGGAGRWHDMLAQVSWPVSKLLPSRGGECLPGRADGQNLRRPVLTGQQVRGPAPCRATARMACPPATARSKHRSVRREPSCGARQGVEMAKRALPPPSGMGTAAVSFPGEGPSG